MSQKIYIVEDDASIRELESYALKSAGFETLGFENSRDFFAQMESHLPDLILLDIMLPGTDGLKVLETIRSTPAYSKLPVILVTAKTGEIDAVKGLDSGADDYITKPFSMRELIARVGANIRRTAMTPPAASAAAAAAMPVSGDLSINTDSHQVFRSGKAIDLTQREYELLTFLASHPNKVYSRIDLMEQVWNYGYVGDDQRTVDVTVRRLREKIEENPASPKYILTRRGVGYYFAV